MQKPRQHDFGSGCGGERLVTSRQDIRGKIADGRECGLGIRSRNTNSAYVAQLDVDRDDGQYTFLAFALALRLS